MLFDGPPRNAKATGIFCVFPRNLGFFIMTASMAEIRLTHPSSWASSLSVFTHNSCAFCLCIRRKMACAVHREFSCCCSCACENLTYCQASQALLCSKRLDVFARSSSATSRTAYPWSLKKKYLGAGGPGKMDKTQLRGLSTSVLII